MAHTQKRTQGFWQEFYESFVRLYGYPLTGVGLVISIVSFSRSSNDTVSLKLAVPVAVVLILCLITFVHMSFRMHSRALRDLPVVEQSREPPAMFPEARALLLLGPSDLYGHEALTSIYYRDEGLEVFIGLGFVFTIQDDGLIQVVVTGTESVQKDLWEKVCNNDKSVLARLMVKPSVPRLFIEGRG